MIKNITSTQNTYIKELIQLRDKSRERKKTGSFIIEGLREINLATRGNFTIKTILICFDFFDKDQLSDFLEQGIDCIEISKEIYQKLAYRSTTEGIIAVARSKKNNLESLSFSSKNPFIVIAEAPEKPGNIGALLRTADAANVDAVIIANPKTDLYNPNIIRSSVGCVFTNQIATGTTLDIISFLKEKNINIYCAILQEAVQYNTQDYNQATAIVVGTEAVGLSEEWRKNSKQNIKIPMQGAIDSMNVSVAAGILIYEVKRQRNFK